MPDPIQSMPSTESMVKAKYTIQDWLNYYFNLWTRNLAARTIDVQTDIELKAIDPEQEVQTDEGEKVPVKQRLELRKILVQDALDLLESITKLQAVPVEEFATKVLSKEALAVAPDMMPPAVQAGDACEIDGKPGTMQSDGKGGLICVATAEPAPLAGEPEPDAPADEASVDQPAEPATPVPGEDAN